MRSQNWRDGGMMRKLDDNAYIDLRKIVPKKPNSDWMEMILPAIICLMVLLIGVYLFYTVANSIGDTSEMKNMSENMSYKNPSVFLESYNIFPIALIVIVIGIVLAIVVWVSK